MTGEKNLRAYLEGLTTSLRQARRRLSDIEGKQREPIARPRAPPPRRRGRSREPRELPRARRRRCGADPCELETAWQALEEAGIVPASLKDTKTGVFVGAGASEYATLRGDAEKADAYATMGTSTSFAAGRLAFTLGVQGPALFARRAPPRLPVAAARRVRPRPRRRRAGDGVARAVRAHLARARRPLEDVLREASSSSRSSASVTRARTGTRSSP
ncbi:hypothetical protein BE20_14720 [Sorangium cellulosum]|nr:hypothetical protein BE20_14720 [Sorangium cellulosum]